VCDTITTDGIGQSLADMILANNITETLWTVFAGYDLIRHRRNPNR